MGLTKVNLGCFLLRRRRVITITIHGVYDVLLAAAATVISFHISEVLTGG